LDAIAATRAEPRGWGPDPLVVIAAQAVQPEPGIARSADPLFAMPELIEVRHLDAVCRQIDPSTLVRLGRRCPFVGYDAERKAAEYIADLSEGHLASARLIATQLRSVQLDEVPRLLQRPVANPDAASTPLCELIVDGLLPDRPGRETSMLRAALPTYAAAFEPEQVCFDAVYAGLTFETVSDALDRLLLMNSAAGRGRTYPLLRRALTRCLARDDGEWNRVHKAFRSHYSDTGHEIAYRYHSLALIHPGQCDELNELAGWLDGALDDHSARQWHDGLLATIASAPNRLSAQGDPEDRVTQLAGPEITGDRGRVVRRLLVALWLHADRDLDPTHRLADTIAHEYQALPRLREGENEVFTEKAAYYRNLAHYWHPRVDV
jgi:hypothetical protein